MRVAITGATGFIGQRLASRLARQHEVVALGLDSGPDEQRRATWLAAEGIALSRTDICDSDALAKNFRGCDAVYHLAAAQHEAGVPDSHFERINVGGARAVLSASQQAGVRRVVYGSTIGVYGDGSSEILSERTPPRPANIYGRTKLAAEEVFLGGQGDVEVSVARISETYGPGDFRLLKLFRGINRGRFPRLGKCANWHHPVFVDDLLTGLEKLASEHAASGERFVLAGPQAITTEQMVNQAASAVGAKRAGPRIPIWPFIVTAVILENTLGRAGIKPPIHRRRLDFFLKSFRFEISHARDLIGFDPLTEFLEGARKTANWYRDEGLL